MGKCSSDNLYGVLWANQLPQKIAIIATSHKTLAHQFYYNNRFINSKKSKIRSYAINEVNQLVTFKEGWERFDIYCVVHQKTFWVEKHCRTVTKLKLTLLQQLCTYVKQHQIVHTNSLPTFYIPFKSGDSNCFNCSKLLLFTQDTICYSTPTKPSCLHCFFNILPKQPWTCSAGS